MKLNSIVVLALVMVAHQLHGDAFSIQNTMPNPAKVVIIVERKIDNNEAADVRITLPTIDPEGTAAVRDSLANFRVGDTLEFDHATKFPYEQTHLTLAGRVIKAFETTYNGVTTTVYNRSKVDYVRPQGIDDATAQLYKESTQVYNEQSLGKNFIKGGDNFNMQVREIAPGKVGVQQYAEKKVEELSWANLAAGKKPRVEWVNEWVKCENCDNSYKKSCDECYVYEGKLHCKCYGPNPDFPGRESLHSTSINLNRCKEFKNVQGTLVCE